MDEDLAIIAKNTRKEEIKSFLIKHKKKFYFLMGLILLSIFSVFFYLDLVKKQKAEIANKFIRASINYNLNEEAYYTKEFKEIINSHDSTYAPLALFFIIDNKVVSSNEEINHLFEQVLNNANLEKEIKNLVIYKKALTNADFQPENIMIEILKPVINSESFWKPHSLLLLGDYFLFKGEKQKAKDFYSQILISQKTNENIFNQAQQRILKNYGE
jgi:predicted negative regulator of RcsB-dependent stress response